MTYLYLYAICIVSPVLGLAEPLALLAAVSGKLSAPLVVVSIAAGQMTCFFIFYQFGAQLRQRINWLQRKLDEIDLSKFDRAKPKITSAAGLFGLPPATALALAGTVYQPRRAQFLLILAITRCIRFAVFVGLPTYFLQYFDVDVLPEWAKNLF
ncbi:MAG: hypothetical protein VX589_04085 [Myxococcota bacterium]|nr:hypothetical protein [Myxococcota bacterium]